MSEQCMSCSKQLGIMKYDSKKLSGKLCRECSWKEIDDKVAKENHPLTGLRIGLAVATVVGLAVFIFYSFS